LAALFALCGAPLAWGGGHLVLLGGSSAYLVGGLALFAVAILLWRGAGLAAPLFAAVLTAATVWSLSEVGLDPWALVPRLDMLAGLALVWLLTAAWRRPHARTPAILMVAGLAMLGLAAALWAGRPPASAAVASAPPSAATDWPHYGGGLTAQKFSTAGQITPVNVSGLTLAWSYRTGDQRRPGEHTTAFEATPLKIGDSLYLCTPHNVLLSLDPDTGQPRWRHDPQVDMTGLSGARCRGVAYYARPGVAATVPCAARIIEAAVDARLIAVDAATGAACADFGQGGAVDLKQGLGLVQTGYYSQTSPPVVVDGRVIVGGAVSDNRSVDEPSGVVRAFDAVTGKLDWAWDLGRAGPAPSLGAPYTRATPNVWSVISADAALDLVFLPTGVTTPDHFSAGRSPLDEKYGTSVVALDARTGALRWSFQTVHHDLWDYDVAAQPLLADFPTPQGPVPAVIEGTKTGQLYVLDRRTGAPLTTVEERPVPATTTPGEWTSKTQPFSVDMPHFGKAVLTEADMWGLSPYDQLWCRIAFRRTRYLGPFTPPAPGQDTFTTPGSVGGINWGGLAIDPVRHLLMVNSNQMAIWLRLVPRDAHGALPKAGGMFGIAAQAGTPYGAMPRAFMSPLAVPCQRPPFGMLSAVDLNTHRLLWSRPLGATDDAGPLGTHLGLSLPMGMPNMGGSVLTASGLTFIAATLDSHIRAFDTRTGRELWREPLSAGGQATPMTYVSAKTGRQYVVVAAGGSYLLGSRSGDYLQAYALPGAGRTP
jgi:membrane-bound PQQ-dependent dehydrogenase (glucose/quinate/shikimate family)